MMRLYSEFGRLHCFLIDVGFKDHFGRTSLSMSQSTPGSSHVAYEVQLAVYDLSRGMARSLSAQFLGPQYAVDAVPHTGLVVYGVEYFFGAGIQSEDPLLFRQSTGLHPLQVLPLGKTRVSQANFEQWCRERVRDGSFDASSYDLLHHNCNTFCHIAAQQALGLPRGVPEWILRVPQRFLASPMGQVLRPMLEQMQLTSAVPGASAVVGSSARGVSPAAPDISAAVPPDNPWANATLPPGGSDATTESAAPSAPVLDSCAKPLLSAETNMVPICVKKLVSVVEDAESLRQAADQLCRSNPSLEPALLQQVGQTLLPCLKRHPKRASFALLLLRLLVLQQDGTLSSSDVPPALQECLAWTYQQLVRASSLSSDLSPTARGAAWLVSSNSAAASSLRIDDHDDATADELVEAALADWTPSSTSAVPVRQAAGSFLCNAAIQLSKCSTTAGNEDDRISNLVTSLLCSALEGLEDEEDPTCVSRRLMVLGCLLRGPPTSTDTQIAALVGERRRLAVDLGLGPVLTNLLSSSKELAATHCSVIREIQELLQTS